MKDLLMKKGIIYWLGHLTAIVLAAVMILTLPFAIAARDLGAVLFSPQRVRTILESRLIESGAIESILARTLFEDLAVRGGDDWYRRATEHLSEPERQELVDLLIPAGWIEDQITSLSESLFAWMQSEQLEPELRLDLLPVKARLLGESLDLAVEIFVDSWPSCTPEEVERLGQALDNNGSFPEIVCEPPEPLRRSIVDLATRSLAAATTQMPDSIELIGPGSVTLQELQTVKNSLRRTQALLAWSWLVPIAALGPIMALKVRGVEELGRWWGLSLFFAGVSTLLLNLVFRGSRPALIEQILAGAADPDPIQFELTAPILEGVMAQVLRLMLLHALLLALVGAGAWFVFTRRSRKIPEKGSPAAGRSVEVEPQGFTEKGMRRGPSPPPLPPMGATDDEEQEGSPLSGIFG
jgi:hypothetical protein